MALKTYVATRTERMGVGTDLYNSVGTIARHKIYSLEETLAGVKDAVASKLLVEVSASLTQVLADELSSKDLLK